MKNHLIFFEISLKIQTNNYFCSESIFCYNKKIKVDNDRNSKRFESVYSKKVRAGKRRTYFFDVRRTKGEDFYLTLTESTKKFDGGYERHKIFLYKEDFNRFVQGLDEAVNYIKTELMPQYDYDEFARRQEEYEARYAEESANNEKGENLEVNDKFESKFDTSSEISAKEEPEIREEEKTQIESKPSPRVNLANDDEEDMSW